MNKFDLGMHWEQKTKLILKFYRLKMELNGFNKIDLKLLLIQRER